MHETDILSQNSLCFLSIQMLVIVYTRVYRH